MKDIEARLSFCARNVPRSQALRLSEKAKVMAQEGADICNLTIGEPDFDTPDFIKEACIEALRSGRTKYSPIGGIPDLRAAVAEKYINENDISGINGRHVIITPGAKFACYLAMQATCDPGDEVLMPSPYWISYPEIARVLGAKPRLIETRKADNFKLTAEALKEAIGEKSRLLVLNTPNNPTGSVYTRKELEAIVEVALKAKLFILSDEIYEKIVHDDKEHVSPASFSREAARSIITISGFSKAFSMTGWRIGTAMATRELTRAMIRLQSHTLTSAATFPQYGALAAMRQKQNADAFIAKMLEAFKRRRDLVRVWIAQNPQIETIPAQGAFYKFLNIESTAMGSEAFAEKLLEDYRVATIPGVVFGNDAYIRISLSCSDEALKRGLVRFTACLEELNQAARKA